MMNPYQRGHTWNPYNCGSGGGGGLPGSSGLTGGPGGGGGGGFLPNRIATLSDVRYRSFQAPAQISSRVAKSRTSLALPPNSNFVHGGGVASSGVGVGAGLGPASSRFFGGSSHQLAHFHEHHHPNEIMRSSCYSHCCGCHCPGHFEYPSLPPNSYFSGSSYDLNHCTSCGSHLRAANNGTNNNNNQQHQPRLFSKNRSSQRFVKQEPWEPMHTRSKSLRWTKEQLEKFDNLIVPPSNESSSSSSGDNLTDDSGIHSKSTCKDSPQLVTKQEKPMKIERVSLGRKPVRKLPTLPPKQAHIVQLKVDQQQTTKRELPKPPVEGGGGEEIKEKKSGTGLRLSNFFRSVKFPRNKKVQTSSNPACRVFGKDLNELAKTTGLEVPKVLTQCTNFIENHGIVDGIYRVSGIASNIKKLKALFDTQTVPEALEKESWIIQDLHCVPSVIKLFFRELPEPLCTEKVWPYLKNGLNMATINSDSREAMPYFKQALNSLNLAPYKVLKHLMLHLQRVSERCEHTGMSSKNLAICWAPNLLRSKILSGAGENIQHNLVQNTQIVQYLIDNAKWLFTVENEATNAGSKVLPSSTQSKNQLPPQYLERVKFIEPEGGQKQRPLSKRYLSSDHKSEKVIFGGLSQAASSAQLHEVRRIWHNGKRPLSMDFSDLEPCFSPTGSHHAQGYFARHHHHHPVTHQHIHHMTKPTMCSVGHDLHVSDV